MVNDTPDGLRWCSRCELWKPRGEFGTEKRAKSGLKRICKRCETELGNEWRKANPEKAKAIVTKSRAKNGRKPNNPEKSKVTQARWRANNQDHIREYREAHREEQRLASTAWRLANPERYAATQVAAETRRRARKRGVVYETFSHLEIFEAHNWICGICELPIDPALKSPDPLSVSLDHIWPLSKGGPHIRANAQPAHRQCNNRKRNQVPEIVLRFIW